jgi:predicted phosphodiesterase
MIDIQKQIESLKDQPMKDNLARLIDNASSALEKSDYPDLSKEFTAFYSSQLTKPAFPALIRINIPDKEKTEDTSANEKGPRVVIIGDIHSDFNALGAIFKKLALSTYDYFSKAIFIFCGDYTDRGRRPLETLRLLYALRTYLGDRCILLKGNHELINYSCSILRPTFSPADTSELMNRILPPEVNNLYVSYLARLPFLVSLTHSGKRYLVCHGSIPRHDYAEVFSEEKLMDCALPVSDYSKEGIMLNQMLWGDPGNASSSFRGTEIRFEFSKAEFIEFMDRNHYDILIRGHQPVDNGVMFCYNNRLISLFSSGGHNNNDSYYPDDVQRPAFVILMEDGEIVFEKVFHSPAQGR